MNARKEEVDSIIELTIAQAKLGVVSYNVQIAGSQELATYLRKTSTLKQLIPVMNDMVAQQFGINASQEQAATVATMLGKVMDGQVGALKRYGYSFDEAQEKILKTGTESQRAAVLIEVVTSAVGGVNKALAQTPQGKIKAAAIEYKAAQEQIGKVVVAIKEKFIPAQTAAIKALSSVAQYLFSTQKKSIEQYDEHIKKVADLEVNTAKLTRRYEELKSKTEITKDEQIELDKIINILTSTVPGIVTEFDKYGKVLSINTQKVWDFIEAEKAKLKYLNRDAIKEAEKNIKEYSKTIESLTPIFEKGYKEEQVWSRAIGDYTTIRKNYSQDQLKEIKETIDKTGILLKGAEQTLSDLNGTTIDNQLNAQKTKIEKTNEFNAMTQKQLAEYIKINKDAADKYVDIAQQIYNSRLDTAPDTHQKESEVKSVLNNELKELENDNKKRQLIIELNENKEWKTEKERQEKLLEAEKDYLNKRISVLEKFNSSYQNLNIEAENKLLEDKLKLNENSLKKFDNELKQLDEDLKQKLLLEQNNLIERKITQKEFEQISKDELTKNLQDKLKLTKKYGYDIFDIERAISDNTLKNQKEAGKLLFDAAKEIREDSLRLMQLDQTRDKIELDRQLKHNIISQNKYNDEILALNTKYAQIRLTVESTYYTAVEEMRKMMLKVLKMLSRNHLKK